MKIYPSKLYVIGNGFDLWHGIPSSYWDFREYVRYHDRDIFDTVDSYLPADENWSDLGYAIAIEPTAVTVRSIEQSFGFVPMGIPGNDWPEGRYRAAQVEVQAEPFCLSCHNQAEVGDVLGVVTVVPPTMWPT